MVGFPVTHTVKILPARQETQVRSMGKEDPLEKGMQPTRVFLPGESHGQRSLAGYSPCSQQRARYNRMTDTLIFLSH